MEVRGLIRPQGRWRTRPPPAQRRFPVAPVSRNAVLAGWDLRLSRAFAIDGKKMHSRRSGLQEGKSRLLGLDERFVFASPEGATSTPFAGTTVQDQDQGHIGMHVG